jgi:hypothetical protein
MYSPGDESWGLLRNGIAAHVLRPRDYPDRVGLVNSTAAQSVQAYALRFSIGS